MASEWRLDVRDGAVREGRELGVVNTHVFATRDEAERARADLLAARAVWHQAMTASSGRIVSLLEEWETLVSRGNVTNAGEVRRAIEDLAGHFRDGAFVGASQIRSAGETCRTFADVRFAEVQP